MLDLVFIFKKDLFNMKSMDLKHITTNIKKQLIKQSVALQFV